MSDLFSVFTTTQGWIELVTLMFLELALGVDNLVFIAITTNRLPESKQHIGRRLGLFGAMLIRCVLLCTITWIMNLALHIELPFNLLDGSNVIDFREIVFFLGGIYLMYKGIAELRELFGSTEDGEGDEGSSSKRIGLPHAVALIMVMDIVFSLDSVITAAGVSGHILIMCLAVILAVLIMIIFADPISNFINRNIEIKVVALTFVFLVGVMLVAESFHFDHIGPVALNTVVYVAMGIGLVVAIILMIRRHRREKKEN